MLSAFCGIMYFVTSEYINLLMSTNHLVIIRNVCVSLSVARWPTFTICSTEASSDDNGF